MQSFSPDTIFSDRYFLIRLLGRGGFAEVWLARDTKTNLEVALKIYAPGVGMDDDGVALFMTEYALVYNLKHSSLLRPSYFDDCNRMPYLVLPYCEQGSVQKQIGRISESQIWKLIKDVASGLSYLHSQKPPLIHQDIKPDNILVDERGDYLISDFGISTRIRSTLRRSAPQTASSGGTRAYMAPERFGSDKRPVKANDIWSLGAMLYELICEDTPFGNEGGLLQKAGSEQPIIYNDNFSDDLKSLVYLCLAPEPWDRPSASQIEEYAVRWFNGERDFITNTKSNSENNQPQKQPRKTEPKIIDIQKREDNEVKSSRSKLLIGFITGLIILKLLLITNSIFHLYIDSSFVALISDMVYVPFFIVEVVSFIMILLRKRVGYYMLISSIVLCNLLTVTDITFSKIILDASVISLLSVILFRKQNSQSIWSLMKKWSLKTVIFGVIMLSSASLAYFLVPLEIYTYERGSAFFTKEDYPEAIRWYFKAADRGCANAQYMLAICYQNGFGVAKDDSESVKWVQKSAEQDNASAQSMLGISYIHGTGVNQDYAKALNWIRKAIEKDNPDAHNALGYCYKYGLGVDKDHKEAVKWYRKATEQDNPAAQKNLGNCYYNGQGVDQDYKEAIKWYQKAANQGEIDAQNNLGRCYLNGQGVDQDYIEAVKWFKKAEVQGDAYAQFNLGVCYTNGFGVDQDDKEAVKWYRKAAEQGNAVAQFYLGVCYYNGHGVDQDYKEAVKWYRKAAEQEDADAQNNLGYCYNNGQGVDQDSKEAVKWYRKAAEQGDQTAQNNLKSMGESW